MILVDSSVWIDFFAGRSNRAVTALGALLQGNRGDIAVADLVMFEVLRGFRSGRALDLAEHYLGSLPQVQLGGSSAALLAAREYHELRAQGVTIRSPIDILLASFCIHQGHQLLHRDADFDLIETLRGLQTWPS